MLRYFALLFLIVFSQSLYAQLNLTYENSEDVIANPDRGFYHHTETNSSSYNFLNESTLSAYRSDGYTLILRVFYLSEFLDSELSQNFLDNMQTDFNTVRNSGMKMIVRFAYTKKSSAPYNDAPLERALIHIAQLKDILHLNSDVISVVQAGFIGAWGEWYYTDHFAQNIGNPSEEDWNNRRSLVEGLLEAVPQDRYVQVRTPNIKMKLTDMTAPIGEGDIDQGTIEARLGHHNDCFLASPNDVGTYNDTTLEKPFLASETKYLPMGGETCGVYEPLSECENTLMQMDRFHWSYINVDYHPDVINNWRTEGCFSEIELKTGYRYRLQSAVAEETAKPKGAFVLDVDLINDGWANAFNERTVELVLRNTDSGDEYYLTLDEDPRFWPLHGTINLTIEGGIPSYMPAGSYKVFLNFPAPEYSIKNNPDYSIQLANSGTWEASTGYNDLLYSINIDAANTGASDYNGDQYFVPRNDGPGASELSVKIDGSTTEWANKLPDYLAEGQSLLEAKSYVSSDSLFLMVSGNGLHSAHQVFINADKSETGYSAWQWMANGADYLIENDILYAYSGVDHAWGWMEIGAAKIARNSEAIEFGIPQSKLNSPSLEQVFSYAHINDPYGSISYLSLQGEQFIETSLPFEMKGPLMASVSGNEAILYWAEDTVSEYHVIERKVGDGTFEHLAVLPQSYISLRNSDLEAGQTYSYRIYASDGVLFSSYSDEQSVVPDGGTYRYVVIEPDGAADDWNSIEPVSVVFDESTIVLKGFQSAANYSFLIQGIDSEKYTLYLNTDGNISTGATKGIWEDEGFDLKVSNDSLFVYQSDSWVFNTKLVVGRSDEYLEFQVAADQAFFGDAITSVSCGLSTELAYLPLSGTATRSFPVYPVSIVPEGFALRRSGTYPESRIVIEWDEHVNNKYVVLERSKSEVEDFEEIALMAGDEDLYRDDNLEASTSYFYRIYSFNTTGRSDYSEVLTISTTNVLAEYSGEKLKVYPTLVEDFAMIELDLLKAKHVRISLLNSMGQEVQMIVNEDLAAGEYDFQLNPNTLAAGMYLLHFAAEQEIRTEVLIIK